MNVDELSITVHADVAGCLDDTFHRWARSGLVWLPAWGMGYFDVSEEPYDEQYFAKYQGYAATPLGHAITASRLALVLRHAGRASSLIDVGVGSGDFLDAARAGSIQASGYDINPVGVAWLESRGLFGDPRRVPVDVLTFWDSLEHISDAALLLVRAREWVFCSLPIVPGDGPPPKDWKHLRPDEHCWYWTHKGLLRWMGEQGFKCVEHNTAESLLGREDVSSFAFRRV